MLHGQVSLCSAGLGLDSQSVRPRDLVMRPGLTRTASRGSKVCSWRNAGVTLTRFFLHSLDLPLLGSLARLFAPPSPASAPSVRRATCVDALLAESLHMFEIDG